MHKLILAAPAAFALAACATMNAPPSNGGEAHAMKMSVNHKPHIIFIKSNNDFEQTLSRLQGAIGRRGFKTFAVIDHAKGAASIGEDLAPTTLIIFGNPKGGTPLIQAEQRFGLQLPLKMLVFEDADGGVYLTYSDMAHLFHEYGISELATPLAKIESALMAIADEAAVE